MYAISVDKEQWTAERAFVVETSSRQNELATIHKMAHIVVYYGK
jgi:hypothetical protein